MNAAVASAKLIEAVAPPEHRGIARDDVRLLFTDRKTGKHEHLSFRQLPNVLHAGDLLVVNDSATLPAALVAHRVNGQSLALHLSTKIDERIWMTEPRGPVVSGEELELPGGGTAVVIAPVDPEHPRLWYTWYQLPAQMYDYLARFGEPIRYAYIKERFPLGTYQTLFAREPGSSEMPSAARPFTTRVLNDLHQNHVELATVTLHCGVASFEAPERPSIERYNVPRAAADAVNLARREGRRVFAAGTTVVRALESAVQQGEVLPSSGWTDLIIDQARGVRVVDGLLTGFHDVDATHQWMLQAFLSADTLNAAYETAAHGGYFQHEFGDVHLIA
jgi:S-adenosylmethionine:tRNA ribosyltransferase-isomerase